MVPTKKEVLNCAIICFLVKEKIMLKKNLEAKRRRYSKKRYWVKTPLLNRPQFDMDNNLLTELLNVEGDFQNFTRLPYEKFLELHEKVRML